MPQIFTPNSHILGFIHKTDANHFLNCCQKIFLKLFANNCFLILSLTLTMTTYYKNLFTVPVVGTNYLIMILYHLNNLAAPNPGKLPKYRNLKAEKLKG